MVSVPPSGRWLSESVRLVTGLSEAPVCGATLATLFTSSIVVIYFPELICARPPTLFLSWMLMTPAMASEPYCDEAPSRSTSIRSIAIGGIVFMSTPDEPRPRSEEHTSELQSLMRISYAVFCLKKKIYEIATDTTQSQTHHKIHQQ